MNTEEWVEIPMKLLSEPAKSLVEDSTLLKLEIGKKCSEVISVFWGIQTDYFLHCSLPLQHQGVASATGTIYPQSHGRI